MDGQLKRGMLDVCVLAAIRKEDSYGYQILKDLRPYVAPDRVHAVVQDACGLAVDYGEWFGGEDYRGYIRLNLATSLDNVMLALDRLIAALTD